MSCGPFGGSAVADVTDGKNVVRIVGADSEPPITTKLVSCTTIDGLAVSKGFVDERNARRSASVAVGEKI